MEVCDNHGMATLKTHKGIETIYLNGTTRYAVCKDGKVLTNRAGTGWKIANPRITPELLAAKVPVDTSHAAKAIISRANADAPAHDAAKRRRRLRGY